MVLMLAQALVLPDVLRGDVIVYLCYFFLAILYLHLGAELANQEQALQAVALCVVIAAFVSFVIALIQVFEVFPDSGWINQMPQARRPGANMGQPNHLGTLLVMGLAGLQFLFHQRRVSAALTVLLSGLFLVGAAISESRTAVLSAAVLFGWSIWARNKTDYQVTFRPLAALFIFFVTFFFSWPTVFSMLQASSHDANVALNSVNTSAGARWVVWPQLLHAALQKPWIGWGVGQVTVAHDAVLDAYATAEPFSFSHNLILDLLISFGFPATILLLVFGGAWAVKRIGQVRDSDGIFLVALMIPVLVHSQLEFPFAYAYFLAPLMFAIGALDRVCQAPAVANIPTRLFALVFAVMVLVFGAVTREYLLIEEDFRVMRFESLKVGKTPADYVPPKISLLTQLDLTLKAGRVKLNSHMSSQDMEVLRQAAQRFHWTATLNTYALALALNHNEDEALRQLRHIETLFGQKSYENIKAYWIQVAALEHPELLDFPFAK